MECDKQATSAANSLPYDAEAVQSPLLCDMQALSTADTLPNSTTPAIKFPLLRLPLELRRMIYMDSILASRCPTPEELHERNFGAIWEDVPSPLFAVNKQIRDEVFDCFLNKNPFTMRVTAYGASFDMLGLSCFIAQQRPKGYGALPRLVVEIWPPHPDRPIEMYNIVCHLRDLRNELRATSLGIANLIIRFKENEIAKWTRDDGQARFELKPLNRYYPRYSDISKVLFQFACVSNVTKAEVYLPLSLIRYDKLDDVRWHVREVIDIMEGKYPLFDEVCLFTANDGLSDLDESFWKRVTAQKARAKLDAITDNGARKMSEAEWRAFTQVWPHFESLTEWDHGGVFKGERHYRSSLQEPATGSLHGTVVDTPRMRSDVGHISGNQSVPFMGDFAIYHWTHAAMVPHRASYGWLLHR